MKVGDGYKFCGCVCACKCGSYQDAIEELVNKESQCGGEHVGQVVDELHIHHHGLVSHDEGAVVSHETHHKHHFVDELQIEVKSQECYNGNFHEPVIKRIRDISLTH